MIHQKVLTVISKSEGDFNGQKKIKLLSLQALLARTLKILKLPNLISSNLKPCCKASTKCIQRS